MYFKGSAYLPLMPKRPMSKNDMLWGMVRSFLKTSDALVDIHCFQALLRPESTDVIILTSSEV